MYWSQSFGEVSLKMDLNKELFTGSYNFNFVLRQCLLLALYLKKQNIYVKYVLLT